MDSVLPGPACRRASRLEGKADRTWCPAAAVTGREVAIDAAVDLIVLGTDVDRLDDLERAVLLDLDVADEALDALFRMSRSSSPEQQQAAEDRAISGMVRPPGVRTNLRSALNGGVFVL